MTDGESKSDRQDRVGDEATRFILGAHVRCRDGDCGRLARVVIDPVARELTHLIVETGHRHGLGRLVPIKLVESSGREIRLGCTAAEFERLDHAEESRLLPYDADEWGYQRGEALALPFYGLGGAAFTAGGLGIGGRDSAPIGGAHTQRKFSARIPSGEVEIRRGDQVRATDGPIGTVQGLAVDPRDHHVTHVLLQEGHLWGRRQVAIPIGAVARKAGLVAVELTKRDVEELPPIELQSEH